MAHLSLKIFASCSECASCDKLAFFSPHLQLLLASDDVEKALQSYEESGFAIPTFVIEMSIFRPSYFTGRFLRALLSPRKVSQWDREDPVYLS